MGRHSCLRRRKRENGKARRWGTGNDDNMIIAAIHGILTNQTDASWPDKFDAWLYPRAPHVKVLKKEYRAAPFPRWNCWVKDPLLARSLANEIELFLKSTPAAPPSPAPAGAVCDPQQTRRVDIPVRLPRPTPAVCATPPPLWFVAHSNG